MTESKPCPWHLGICQFETLLTNIFYYIQPVDKYERGLALLRELIRGYSRLCSWCKYGLNYTYLVAEAVSQRFSLISYSEQFYKIH